MKKAFSFLFLASICSIILTSCVQPIPSGGSTPGVSEQNNQLSITGPEEIYATESVSLISNVEGVHWSVTEGATITQDGYLTAGDMACLVTVTTELSGYQSATKDIVIAPLNTLEITGESSVYSTESIQLEASVEGVHWAVTEGATITQTGLLTADNVSKAKNVTVTATKEHYEVAEHKVTINPYGKITINSPNTKIFFGDTLQLSSNVQGVEWAVTEGATITQTGLLTAGTVAKNVTVTASKDKYITATKEIEISHFLDLKLELSSLTEEQTKGAVGATLMLPTITATGIRGEDLSSQVKINAPIEDEILGEFITLNFAGSHVVTFTLEEPGNPTNKVEKSVTYTAYKTILTDNPGDFSVQNPTGTYKEQVVTSSNGGYTFTNINVNASKYFYLESTITVTTSHGGIVAGLGQRVNDTDLRTLILAVDAGDVNAKIVDFNSGMTATGIDYMWDLNEWGGRPTIFSYQVGNTGYNYLNMDVSKNWSTIKLAILRMNNTTYTFINDQYFMAAQFDYYKVDTYPSLFAHNPQGGGMKWTNFALLEGQQSVASQFNALTNSGKDLIKRHVGAGGNIDFNANNASLVKNETDTLNGVNFTMNAVNADYNDGMFSQHVWFQGDFTYEFDYKSTEVNTTGKESHMRFELRSQSYSEIEKWDNNSGPKTIMFGVKFGNTTQRCNMEVYFAGIGSIGEEWRGSWNISDYKQDPNYEYHYKIQRVGNDFIMSISPVSDPAFVITKTITFETSWIMCPIFRNLAVSGTASHIYYTE